MARRRFVIAIIGTGIVFAMTLVLTGLANGFRVEARHTVDSLSLDAYLIKAGAVGPFQGSAPFPEAVERMWPRSRASNQRSRWSLASGYCKTAARTERECVRGVPTRSGNTEPGDGGGTGERRRDRGIDNPAARCRRRRPNQLSHTANRRTRLQFHGARGTGQRILHRRRGAAAAVFGAAAVSAIGLRGIPTEVPKGYRIVHPNVAMDDPLRPLQKALAAISYLAILLWAVAALIVGSLIYLSALERTRDFAVFKAVGVSTRSVLAGLALQAVVVAVVAARSAPCSRWASVRCSRYVGGTHLGFCVASGDRCSYRSAGQHRGNATCDDCGPGSGVRRSVSHG